MAKNWTPFFVNQECLTPFLRKFLFVSVLLFTQSCESDSSKNDEQALHYFFTGHCYQWGAPNDGRADYRLEKIRMDTFDQVWLGGDLVENMFQHPQTIEYVDSFFQVGKPTVHWAMGNHDVLDQNADFSGIEAKTHRKTYNSTHFDGITMLVLNTTEFGFSEYYHKPHECETLDGQWNLIKNITDTIQESSHLVILHHHALLTNKIANDSVNVQKIFNLYTPKRNIGCEVRGTFEELVYPKLKAVQDRGVQVILIGGDTGQQVKEFEFETEDGIIFLGSGLNNSAGTEGMPDYFNQSPDKVLIFKHRPKNRTLEWEFRVLEEMIY